MFVSPNTPSAISFKSKRKRTKGSKKRRIASLAKTLNIFVWLKQAQCPLKV